MLLADNLNQLLEIVPDFIRRPLESHPKQEILIEIVLDIGRRPEARFADGSTEYLSYRTIVWQDLDLLQSQYLTHLLSPCILQHQHREFYYSYSFSLNYH